MRSGRHIPEMDKSGATPIAWDDSLSVRLSRAGDAVASQLRTLILSGQLADGQVLPRQEDLLPAFGVSHPSLREGLRILEAEGLIVIRRGKFGGAVVQRPKTSTAAYSVGLVLQSMGAGLHDLAGSLEVLEPVCFALVAGRADRRTAVVPLLGAACDRLEEELGHSDFTWAAREFHELVVRHCGNPAITIAIGSLTRLWTLHEKRAGGGQAIRGSSVSAEGRREVIVTHRKLLSLIDEGKVEEVGKLAEAHTREAQHYVLDGKDEPIDVANLPFRARRRT